MKPKHLKALEHLPAVIEALEALEKEQSKLRALMMRTAVATTSSGDVLAPSPSVSASIAANVTENMETAARLYTPNPASPLDVALKADQDRRKAEQRAYLKSREGEKLAKLQQFKRPEPGEQIVEITHESEATNIRSGDA